MAGEILGGRIVLDIAADADDVRKNLKSSFRGALLEVEAFKAVLSGAGKALGALAGFLSESVAAAAEQDRAMVSLTAALGRAGVQGAQAATAEFAQFASELQRTTQFGDEVTIAAASIGASFGITGKKLQETTRAAADFATVTGTDLNSAMMLLGKAAAGNVAMLGRYGIKVKEGLAPSEAFAAALDQINARFGGAAAAAAETYSGRLTILQNAWSDLQETIGTAVTQNEVVNAVMVVATDTLVKLNAWMATNTDTMKGWVTSGWSVVVTAVHSVLSVIGFLGKMFQGLRIVGTGALLLLVKGWQLQLKAVELLNKPFSLILDGLVALGAISMNPLAKGFEMVNQTLEVAAESFGEVLKEQVDDFGKWDDTIKAAHAVATTYDRKVRETAASINVLGGAAKAAGPPIAAVVSKDAERALESLAKKVRDAQRSLAGLNNTDVPITQVQAAAVQARAALAALLLQAQALAARPDVSADDIKAMEEKVGLATQRMEAMRAKALELGATITQAFVSAGEQIGAAWAAVEAGAMRSADAIRVSLKAVAQSALDTMKQVVIAAAVKAAAEAFAAHQTVPFIGFALGAAAAGAAFAYVSSLMTKAQTGGIVSGGIRGRDSVPIMAEPGELILPAEVTAGLLKASRTIGPNTRGVPFVTGMAGFQRGGVVGPGGSGGGPVNLTVSTLALPNRGEARRWIRDVLMPEMAAVRGSS